jgi:hypothetical protein
LAIVSDLALIGLRAPFASFTQCGMSRQAGWRDKHKYAGATRVKSLRLAGL